MSTVPTKLKRDELLLRWLQRRQDKHDLWFGAAFMLPLLSAPLLMLGWVLISPAKPPPSKPPQKVERTTDE